LNFSLADDDENMQTLVSDDLLTNNVHNTVSDTLLLIENGDIPARADGGGKGKVFT
jgi:hypothetical protein